MVEPIKKIINANNSQTNARIVTDSKSLVANMKGTSSADPPKSSHAASLMLEMIESERKGHNITIVWCSSHCRIVGNDWADTEANAGSLKEQEMNDFSSDTAKCVIRRTIKNNFHNDMRSDNLKRVYRTNGENIKGDHDKVLSRSEQVNISRIRSGHHPKFLYWRKKFKLLEDEQTDVSLL